MAGSTQAAVELELLAGMKMQTAQFSREEAICAVQAYKEPKCAVQSRRGDMRGSGL
jgi:hypothetical protein